MSRPLTTAQDASDDNKSGREGIGRSRGGLTTKIYLAADLRCRPVARLTSPGQHGDSPYFTPPLEAISIRRRGKGRPRRRPGRAMADKAYSSRANRAWLRNQAALLRSAGSGAPRAGLSLGRSARRARAVPAAGIMV